MQYVTEHERLVAEQAVLNFRELMGVAKNAQHGKGMAVMEQAVRAKGFEQMRITLSLLAGVYQQGQMHGAQIVTGERLQREPT